MIQGGDLTGNNYRSSNKAPPSVQGTNKSESVHDTRPDNQSSAAVNSENAGLKIVPKTIQVKSKNRLGAAHRSQSGVYGN